MAIVRSIMVPFVQDQPQIEAWIRTGDQDGVALAVRHRFVKPRMLVAVEYRPDLICFLERILPAATASTEAQLPGVLHGSRGDGVGNPDTTIGLYRDERV